MKEASEKFNAFKKTATKQISYKCRAMWKAFKKLGLVKKILSVMMVLCFLTYGFFFITTVSNGSKNRIATTTRVEAINDYLSFVKKNESKSIGEITEAIGRRQIDINKKLAGNISYRKYLVLTREYSYLNVLKNSLNWATTEADKVEIIADEKQSAKEDRLVANFTNQASKGNVASTVFNGFFQFCLAEGIIVLAFVMVDKKASNGIREEKKEDE